jgi:hypothetical protein
MQKLHFSKNWSWRKMSAMLRMLSVRMSNIAHAQISFLIDRWQHGPGTCRNNWFLGQDTSLHQA